MSTIDIAPSAGDAAYRDAALAVCHRHDPVPALRRALDLDPTHAPAAVDLEALVGEARPDLPTRSRWERRHVEIVRAAATDPRRAEVLLREHAGIAGCDPLALLIVARHIDGLDGDRLADLRGRACDCWT